MKTSTLFAFLSMLVFPLEAMGQTTVFSDNFGTSTLNPTAASPGTLNSTTTAYEIASAKNATTTTLANNKLTLSTAATTSGFTEAQALFTASPVILSAPGQYIEIYFTFTDTANVLNGSATNGTGPYLGLYYSGGSGPTNGTLLWSSGMSSSMTTATNGGVKKWLGYSGDVVYSAGSAQSSAVIIRPAQTTANNLSQELLYASQFQGSSNIKTLSGVLGQPALTTGNVYTLALQLTYVSATNIGATETLYNGAGIGGTVYSSGAYTATYTGNSTPAQDITTQFDGLAVGYRAGTSPSTPTTLAITNITVIDFIPAAPTISGVTNQTIVQGNNTVLSAAVTGTPTPGLQWYYSTDGGVTSNGIPGATSSSLSLNNVQYSQNNYIYYLVATNSQGSAVGSMTLSVIVPPAITGLSSTASASPGDNVSFSPTVTGVPAPALQWQTNGVNLADGLDPNGSTISGSQTSMLTITNAQAGDSATYSLIASNSAGIVTNSVTLTVSAGNVLPSFAGPYAQTNIQGSTATFTVSSISGIPTPTLQWLDQTLTPIPGQTGNSLVLPNVQFSQNGYTYYLVASNSVGLVTNGATLTVIVPPFISSQPASLVVTNTQSASFTVVETGGEPAPTYQWYQNNSPISSAVNPTATNATFTIASAGPTNNGSSFYVQISNSAGSTNSASVTLTVNSTMGVSALLPADDATGVCYDTPLYLTFDQTPTLGKTGKIQIFNVTNSAQPVDTIDLSLNVSPNGNAMNVQPRTIASDVFTNHPVIITGNQAAIYPHLDVLTSNQTYYVIVQNGAFSDSAGAGFAGITATDTWQFTTKVGGPANPTNLLVAADGSGDFVTVQGALDSVPGGNTAPTLITINNGNYLEIVDIRSKNHLTLRGQSRNGTVIGYANNANLQPSTHFRMAMKINANDISLDNLTVTNLTPVGGSQAEALMLESNVKRFIMNNCNLGSYQDTLLANGSAGAQAYFNNDLISGQFDYIWGGGDCFFTNCELRTELGVGGSTSGGNLTASRTDNSVSGNWPGYNGLSANNGFSFVNCMLTRATNTIINTTLADSNGTTNGNVAWINCSIDTNYITPSAGVLNSQLLWEYGNSNLADTASETFGLAVGDSAPALTGGDPRLVAAENATNWLYGWQPQLAPNILTNPVSLSVSGGASASFSVVATGIGDPTYQWLQNGNPLAGQTNSTLVISQAYAGQAGTYTVIVSNAAGVVVSSPATLTVGGTAPSFTPVSDQTIGVGITLMVTNIVTDPDVPPKSLSFVLLTGPPSASVDPGTGVFTWRAPVASAGTTNPVAIVVSDNGSPSLSATQTFNVIVNLVASPVTTQAVYSQGQFSMLINGDAGPDYIVQTSTNLFEWQNVSTNLSPTLPFSFTDTNAGSVPVQFYRVLLGP